MSMHSCTMSSTRIPALHRRTAYRDVVLQDTSTGAIVAQHRTRMGTCNVMRQNPWNAVMNLGHSNGVVSMWTPNMSTPVVKMLCHKVSLGSLYRAVHL